MQSVIDTLYPADTNVCVLCHRPMRDPSEAVQLLHFIRVLLRRDGKKNLESSSDMFCIFCQQDLASQLTVASVRWVVTPTAPRRRLPIVCYTRYEGSIRNVIRQWKYDGRLELTTWFASQLINVSTAVSRTHSFDTIVPVPTTRLRLRSRGYHHTLLLARALGVAMHLPVNEALRCDDPSDSALTNRPQMTKSASERRRDASSKYFVSPSESVRDRRVLLVDDVLTTGATMTACAAALVSAGARSIVGLVIADVP